jgi:indole-3-glycerol phosphate synthase
MQAAGEVPIIGDIKLRSPEHGDLARGRNPVDIAQSMIAGGAVAVSVVTEAEHYNGSINLLETVCNAVSVPVLRKDFVSNEQDITDTKNAGADALLLTCCIMSKDDMDSFYPVCVETGLEPLIETHNDEEIDQANRLNAGLIGINNRNIQQWEQDDGDVSCTEKLVSLAHRDAVIVSESSIMTHDNVLTALKAGAHAVLIGTALLQADNIIEKMKELRGAR